MNYRSRLQKAYEGAAKLPLTQSSKYVLFSDCHRGVGNSNDNFLKNQPLYTAALQHYLRSGFEYVELGDGDELWENRRLETVLDAHSNAFCLLKCFHEKGRLHMLYGNHDIIKEKSAADRPTLSAVHSCDCSVWPCCCHDPRLENQALFPHLCYHEGILLEPNPSSGARNIFLVHGHQADSLNSTFWPLARFLVRYLWKPLERYGFLDPTSAVKNYRRKRQTEERLHEFARRQDLILIAGHTHRPLLAEADLSYCNCGSCVHPYTITCLEIERMQISLVKWQLTAGSDMRLYAAREVMAGPASLD